MDVRETARHLRERQQDILSSLTQAQVVDAVSQWAHGWRDPEFPMRREAEVSTDPFPFAHVSGSLNALLDNFTPAVLWKLIDAEGVREAQGVALVGHVIASNTPLLAWTSVLRALLMRSASLVKLPSGPAAQWGHWFHKSLAEISPALASCVHMMQWPGGVNTESDAALCGSVDTLLAYGGDETIKSLRDLCPPCVNLIAYGHRVSLGVAAPPAKDWPPQMWRADGFARDILTYDGGGCLTPQVIYVHCPRDRPFPYIHDFAAALAAALEKAVLDFPLPVRAVGAAARVREARALAQMEPDTRVWGNDDLRWTVVARPQMNFVPSVGHGVVSVQPFYSNREWFAALTPVVGRVQGLGLSGNMRVSRDTLGELGFSYVCPAGQMQTPPFGWREDGRDLLACLR